MRRILGFLLAALLLCGCTAQPQTEATTFPCVTEGPTAVPTEPAGIYEPDSDAEIRTEGAVRTYHPSSGDCYGMRMIGGDVLLFSGREKTTLTRLTGENLFTIAGIQLDCLVDPDDSTFRTSDKGITYYDDKNREVVFLDNDLKEVSRLGMPAEMMGQPILSSNRMKVYYCTADAVRVHDLESGLDKLLRSVSYPQQSVQDILLNDTVLRIGVLDEQEEVGTLFLSVQTGELLGQIRQEIPLSTGGNRFYAVLPEGTMNLLLFGTDRENATVVTPRDPEVPAWFLAGRHGLVTVSSGMTSSVLDYYDLESGRRTGSVELSGSLAIWNVEENPYNGHIWLMGCNAETGDALLYSWLPEASAVADETVFTGPRYTLEAPDTAGLEKCRIYAETLSRKHGVQILIGSEAAREQPWDYSLEAEYQVPVIQRELRKLEQYLGNFPDGFFAQLHGTPRICLVRSITGNAQSGSVGSASGLQFWQGEGEYVALAAGDTLEYAFYHEMFHVMDGKILSDSVCYYDWHQLNPRNFTYFEDYSTYASADLSQYLKDDTRAFIDAYSASFPKEDRARIMEYACTEGNAHYFTSEIMQNKLRTLCRGIREAFGLEDREEAFLWEQYLEVSAAP